MKVTREVINEFLDRLTGKEGCDFVMNEQDPLQSTWNCDGVSHKHSRKILKSMGLKEYQIEMVLDVAKDNGGYCDCEILLNADDNLLEHFSE
jgi:hypothetical protein